MIMHESADEYSALFDICGYYLMVLVAGYGGSIYVCNLIGGIYINVDGYVGKPPPTMVHRPW